MSSDATAPRPSAPADATLRDLLITDGFACYYLSVRTASGLRNRFHVLGRGEPTIGAIVDTPDEELLRVPTIGPVAVKEVHRLRAAVSPAPAVATTVERAATKDTIHVPGAWRYQRGPNGWYIVVGDEVADIPEDRYTSLILDHLADRLAAISRSTEALDAATAVHLRRHTRLARVLSMDPGYSADATIDAAIKAVEALARAQKRAEEWHYLKPDVDAFVKWAQSNDVTDAGRWAGHSVFNAVRTEYAEMREALARVEQERDALAELARFARTAPGRLPQRVQDALAVADSAALRAHPPEPT